MTPGILSVFEAVEAALFALYPAAMAASVASPERKYSCTNFFCRGVMSLAMLLPPHIGQYAA